MQGNGEDRAVDETASRTLARPLRITVAGLVVAAVAGTLIHASQTVLAPEPGAMQSTTMMKHLRYAQDYENGLLYFPNGLLYRLVNFGNELGIPRNVGMVLLLGTCTAIVWYVSYRFAWSRLGRNYTARDCALVAGLTMVVNAIYVPGFSRGVYRGLWGPNVYHNPTHTLVLAFAVPLFLGVGTLFIRTRDMRQVWFAAGLSLALTVSVYAKPTWLIILAPATVLYAAMRMGITVRTALLLVILLALPTVFLLHQRELALTTPLSRFLGRTNAFEPFYVWNYHSKSVPVSIALVFAFPIVFAASAWRHYRFDAHMALAWLIVLTATCLASLLVEVDANGRRLISANWFGGYLIANHMLFLVAIVEFFRWRTLTPAEEGRGWRYRFCVLLLTLHTLSGFYYLYRLQFIRGSGA